MKNLTSIISQFFSDYNPEIKDRVWIEQSKQIHDFLKNRVLAKSKDGIGIPDDESDVIIRILDRSGKGNKKDCEAVARAMVPQGAWRRLFNEFHSDNELGSLIIKILDEGNPEQKIKLIDTLYKLNEGRRNNLTGPSGNTICAFLAAYDPFNNLSIISLKDRCSLIDYLELDVPFDWKQATIGMKIVLSNEVLLNGLRKLGIEGSARTISRFCYFPVMKSLWKGEHTIKRTDKSINVTVPSAEDNEISEELDKKTISDSMQIQALISSIGETMGFTIWLPKADRARILMAWAPKEGVLLDDLPLSYDSITMKTIENIDVLWLRKRSIVRAFEVEHTTAVYSGLLRMADLVALQPNININLHIVADETRREKSYARNTTTSIFTS